MITTMNDTKGGYDYDDDNDNDNNNSGDHIKATLTRTE